MKRIILVLLISISLFAQNRHYKQLVINSGESFTPDKAGTLWAWYNGSNVVVSGDSIVRVTDLSNNSRDLTVSTGKTSPDVITNGKNGHNTIRHDGVNETLIKVSARNQPYTLFIVVKVITFTANRYLWDGTGSGANGGCYFSGTNGLRCYAGTYNLYNSTVTNGNWYLLTIKINGASSTIQINNGTVVTADAGALNSTGISIGNNGSGNAPSNIEWESWIIYSGVVSDVNTVLVKDYLNKRNAIY